MKTTNKKEFSYYRLRLESYLKDYPPERLADEAKVKLVPDCSTNARTHFFEGRHLLRSGDG